MADYANSDDLTEMTVSTGPPCPHQNGWFQTVKFWIFRKRVFLCLDCERIVDLKDLEEVKE